MDFIKTTGSQLFQSTSPLTRVVSIIVLFAIIGGGSYYFNRTGIQQQVLLFNGQEFSNTELAAIETALGKAGINDYEVIEDCVQIPQQRRSEIIKAIADSNAMPKRVSGFDQAGSSFMPFMTSYQQRNLDKAKKQQKICAMIREIEGIEDVLVEYDETRSEGFPRTTQRTAAVTVRSQGARHLEKFEIETVRSTVRRAVAGLKPEEIVVIDGNSAIAHDWNGKQQSESPLQNFVAAKQHYEESWKNKIKSVLQCYPGARIDVQVEFEKTARQNPTAVRQNMPAQKIATSVQTDDKSQTKPGQPGQAMLVSAGSNGPARIAKPAAIPVKLAGATIVRRTSVQTDKPLEYVPQYANVSISVPESLIRKLAVRRLAQMPVTKPVATEGTRTESVKSPLGVTQTDLQQCFESVKLDMVHRVAPMLPGCRELDDASQFIAVSLDPSLDTPKPETTNNAFRPWQAISNFDFGDWSGSWLNYLIPTIMLVGFILLKMGQRSNQRATEAHQREQAQLRASELRLETNLRQRELELKREQMERSEIEHNSIEPSAHEAKMATDIDRAFEHEHQSKLSSEIFEMTEQEPKATIRVFRDWVSESASKFRD